MSDDEYGGGGGGDYDYGGTRCVCRPFGGQIYI
jgi:hypothetical protein